MGNITVKPEILAALGIAISFFLPWAQIFGFSVSGYNLARIGSYGNWAWVILISSGVTILAYAVEFDMKASRFIGGLTGALPIGALIYVLNNAGKNIFHILAIGVYLGILSGAALLICTMLNDGEAAKEANWPARSREIPKPRSEWKYKTGEEVHHQIYGRGVIKNIIENGNVKVFFYDRNAEYEVLIGDISPTWARR